MTLTAGGNQQQRFRMLAMAALAAALLAQIGWTVWRVATVGFDIAGFVRYTGRALSFMPSESIWLLAVAATVCEVSLCTAMFVGIKTRWASAGSAILLFMFATSMVISGLSQFEWAVYVLAAGALMLATVDATRLSLDSIVFGRERTWNTPVAMRH